jgi:hypothetical protein
MLTDSNGGTPGTQFSLSFQGQIIFAEERNRNKERISVCSLHSYLFHRLICQKSRPERNKALYGNMSWRTHCLLSQKRVQSANKKRCNIKEFLKSHPQEKKFNRLLRASYLNSYAS